MNKVKRNNIMKFFAFLPNLTMYIFCIFILFTLITCVFVFPNLFHPLQKEYVKYNWLFLTIAICLGILLIISFCIFKLKYRKKQKLNYKKFFIIAPLILFVLQIFIIYGKFFIAGWDVGRIFFTTPANDYYFSIYPNNLFMKGIVTCISNIIKIIPGLTTYILNTASSLVKNPDILAKISEQTAAESITYGIFVFANCIFINLSVLFTSLITKKLFSQKISLFVYLGSAIFIGLMPWILVPYSDTFAMFFVILILYSYINIHNTSKKLIIISLSAIIGFNIKPTVIFILISIILIELCFYIYDFKNKNNLFFNKTNRNTLIKNILCITISCIISLGIVTGIKNVPDINIDKNKEYTSTHYLMMGSNCITWGYYFEDDVKFSDSFPTVEEREKHNIELWKGRLGLMGLDGSADLLFRKNMANYSDGTFMWAMEAGPMFSSLDIGKNELVNWIYNNYHHAAQIIWFFILIGCILSFIKSKNNKYISSMALSLIFLSLFLMIFECGARYLILYLPCYIILSTSGWREFSAIIYQNLKLKLINGN